MVSTVVRTTTIADIWLIEWWLAPLLVGADKRVVTMLLKKVGICAEVLLASAALKLASPVAWAWLYVCYS